MAWLDLDELDTAFAGRWLWSTKRRAWSRFRREDHLGDPDEELAESVRNLVAQRLGRRPAGPVCLLTNPRVAGFRMNPVSFFYCYAADGETLEALVAEVTNTPWDERHCYVLDLTPPSSSDSDGGRPEHAKTFHVSPFMPMDQRYAWRVGRPGERLSLSIESRDEAGTPVFDAGISMQRVEITGTSLASVLVRMPLMTLSVAFGIYWQALRLKLRGARFYSHPGSPEPRVEATS